MRTTARGEFALRDLAADGWCGCRRSSCRPCRPLGGAPSPVRWGAAGGLRRPAGRRGAADHRAARRRRAGRRARHRPGHRQAGHHRLPRRGPTGRPSRCATATGSSGPPRCTTATRTSSSSRATPSCCASPRRSVRPQGRAAGGMAGIRLSPGASVTFFGAVDPGADNVVVTSAGSSDALPGTQPGLAQGDARTPSTPPRGAARAAFARTGSCAARTPSCWPGSAPSRPGPRVRTVCALELPGGHRQARRVRHGLPGGHRGGRRAGALTPSPDASPDAREPAVLRNRYRLGARDRCAACVNAFTLVPVPSSPRPTTRLGATSEMEAGNGPQLKAPHCGVVRSPRGGPDRDGLRKQ